MKKIISSFIVVFLSALFVSAQDVVVCNFDNIWPKTEVTGFGAIQHKYWNTGGVTGSGIVADPSDMGNTVASITPANLSKTHGGGISFKMSPDSYSSNDYSAISFKVKSSSSYAFRFFQVLGKQTGGQVGNYTNFLAYTGGAAWQTIIIPILASQKNYTFDIVTLNLTVNAAEEPIADLQFYLDDVMLVPVTTAIKLVEASGSEKCAVYANGILNIKNINNPTAIKIYSAAGLLIYESVQNNDFSINLSDRGLSSGLFLVNMNDGREQVTRKIIL